MQRLQVSLIPAVLFFTMSCKGPPPKSVQPTLVSPSVAESAQPMREDTPTGSAVDDLFGIDLFEREDIADVNPERTTRTLRSSIRELGSPISFQSALTRIQTVPRFRGEFETTVAFQKRQSESASKFATRCLLEVPLEIEHVRYDADSQRLLVSLDAFGHRTYIRPQHQEPAFGYTSELERNGYDLNTVRCIGMMIFHKEETTGYSNRVNAFGTTVRVRNARALVHGVVEEKSKYQGRDLFPREDQSLHAFEVPMSPSTAKGLNKRGLRAALLFDPLPPYYATGVWSSEATINDTNDVRTDLKYLIGDIQCAVLYGTQGEILATTETR